MIKPNNRAFGAKGKQANRASPVEMHPFCLRHLPRRGRSALRFLVELCGAMLSTHSPPSEAGGKVVAPATKGGRRRQAAIILAPVGAYLHPAKDWFQQFAFGFISRNSIAMISGLRPLFFPPFGAFGTTFLHGKACHWILGRPRAPYESSSLATPQKRGTMDTKQCAT